MNIMFLLFHGFSEYSGISKKIHYQVKGLRQLGHRVDVCTYKVNDDGHRVRMINDEVIQDYGTGKWAAFKKRIDYRTVISYAVKHHIEVVYIRSFHNANPFTIRLFTALRNAGIKIAMEIPTYPYDQEYVGFSFLTRMGIFVDKLFRRRLAKQVDAIVTFSNDEKIFGQRTIRISNGIDFEALSLQQKSSCSEDEIHLTGVAEVHYWHGYDRLIAGLGEYYKSCHTPKVFFHIVGGIAPSEMEDSLHAPGFRQLIEQYNIAPYVIFHGAKFGTELDDIFNQTDVAIGSLARHRSGITHIRTLKNREYAARGIPFVYSETDDDFDGRDYVLKVPADETPIDIGKLISFYKSRDWDGSAIRQSVMYLSWKEQMRKVLQEL